MKRSIFLISVVCLALRAGYAQPMSGAYTVGGTSPDFATLQECANALKRRGVSGPVFINIRPGIYMENGGASTVLVLDSVISGLSSTNRITFQPDAAAGGTVDNVILQVDQTTQNQVAVVRARIDFLTLRNLSFRDADSGQAGAEFLVAVETGLQPNPTIDGLIVEGCKFLGNPINTDSLSLGTDYGLYGDLSLNGAQIRGNVFHRLLRAVNIGMSGSGIRAENIVVEDNRVLASHSGRLAFGTAIGVAARKAIIRRNVIDGTGSRGTEEGIALYADTGLVERNLVINNGSPSTSTVGQNFDYDAIVVGSPGGIPFSRSMAVVNNMIAGNYSGGGPRVGISVRTKKARIIHNTIVHPRKLQQSVGIEFSSGADSCTVVNNIVMDYGIKIGGLVRPLVLFDQTGGTNGLITDYNVFYLADTNGIYVRRGSTSYTTLRTYQEATGLDSHSVNKEVDFIGGNLDLHLSPCQAQDSSLVGLPLGVLDDFDGDPRSLTAPFRGADEGRLRTLAMFGDVFRASLPGFVTDMDAGRFDNLIADGIALADWENSQIRLYHNNSSSRSFVLSRILNPGFRPTNVKLFDLDSDGNLDVVTSGDTSVIRVYWGDGAGGFPSDTTIETHLFFSPVVGVVALDTGRVTGLPAPTILVSTSLRTPPVRGFLGYLDNRNGRHNILYRVVQRPALVPTPDTIQGGVHEFITTDLDANGDPEIAGILNNLTGTDFIVANDTNAQGGGGFLHFGARYNYNVGARPYTKTASLLAGRFDADADLDLITTAAFSGQCIFLRHQGNFSFIADTIQVNNEGAYGLAKMDYDNDGDFDFISANTVLETNGITVFLNDGTGHFRPEFNCYQPLASGVPLAVVASDFDLDGRKDLAIASSYDTLFVLYNFGNVTGIVTEPPAGRPTEYFLSQNYPNPFNPTTTIRYALPKSVRVNLSIYNILGQHVATLVDEMQEAGVKTVTFHAGNLASGVYFYRLEAGNFVQTKKLVLLR